jgi:hypothetical protein
MTRKYRAVPLLFCSVLVFTCLLFQSLPAHAQDATVTGNVVSLTQNTITVSSGTGQYQLYVFGRNFRRPDNLAVGSQVRVVSSAGSEPGVRVANQITVLQAPANRNQETGDSVIPADLRRVENDIEREARRYQLAVRGGVALDPELVLIGVQGQLGPFFRSDVFFRPSVEFGLGEVTAMFAFNGDMVYRLPFSSARDRWSTYLGAGIGLNLLHQSFDEEEDGRRIDFGDFHSDTALNILAGVRRRGGMFLELKTSIYAGPSPTLRMVVGYTF